MISNFPIGPKAAQIGMILYGSRFRKTVFKLNDYRSTVDAESKVALLQNSLANDYVTFGSITSSLKSSLEDASRVLREPSLGARKGVTKRVVVFAPSEFYIPRSVFDSLGNNGVRDETNQIEAVLMKLTAFPSPDETNTDQNGIVVEDRKGPTDPDDRVSVLNVTPLGPNIGVDDDGLESFNLDDVMNALKPGTCFIN